MLGDILRGLTEAAQAEEVLSVVGGPEVQARVAQAAADEGVAAGALVASRVRHLVEHGGEEVWLDLVGAMANSPQPAAAAVERVLALAFPGAVQVRVTRLPS